MAADKSHRELSTQRFIMVTHSTSSPGESPQVPFSTRRFPLALWFIFPSAVCILVFFILPVILTFITSFTTMSSDTGIFGNRYVFSQEKLAELETADIDAEILTALSKKTYLVNQLKIDQLQQTDLNKKTIKEIEEKLLGKKFSTERELMNELKKLKHRPRSFKDRKQISKTMLLTILGKEFHSKQEVEEALDNTGIKLSKPQLNKVLDTINLSWKWTLVNYKEVFAGQFTGQIFLNTILYVSVTLVFLNIGLALLLAILTFYLPKGQSNFFRAVWLIPRISPSVVYILLWKWFGSNEGFISFICGFLGIPATNWIHEMPWLFIFLVNGFIGASMGMIIFSSAMQAIPKPMLWAAQIDGANKLQQVTRIILPQLKWPILFITSYQTLSLLTSFEHIQLLTDGGPGFYTTEVWSLYAFHQALFNYFGNLRYGFGSALAVVLVVIGITASLLYLKFFQFNELVKKPLIEE